MRNIVKILFISCLLFGSALAVPAPQANADTSRYLVELSKKPADLAASLKEWSIIRSFSLDGHYYAVLTGEKSLQELKNNPAIISAGIDRKTTAASYKQTTPWGVKKSQAYRLNAKDCACKIAIIDSGISDHEDLKGRVQSKITYLYGKEIPKTATDTAKDQHGTHVAGIIAANNNTFGVTGMVPNAKLMVVKVFEGEYGGYFSDITAGIAWAVNNGAEVMNISLGVHASKDEVTERVLKSAYDKGVTIVAASGNEGSIVDYPASSAYTIAVGAVDKYYRMPEWSNYGKGLDILAPGVDILSTVNTTKYVSYSGTSMAAPHVTAAISKLLPLYTGPKNGERVEWVRSRLKDYADVRSVAIKGRTLQVPVLNLYKSYYGLK
ncbi:S8 family peptidase [Bacillus sp. SJS]|uniref:S8 family peptidase n=1 Tax=Bacillus sp. SJS TaxID=1423321 RepID=UPI0006899F3A|nr:S8 family peptidase [Bacillus sp. SJS]